MWRNIRDYVLVEASSMLVGDSVRMSCPSCGENTFTITRGADVILYNCFRATCGVHGACGGRSSWEAIKARSSNDGDDRYHEAYALSDLIDNIIIDSDLTERISKAFNLSGSREFGVDRSTGRVVFPNYGVDGSIRGVTLRRYGEGLGGVSGAKVIFKPVLGYEIKERLPSWYSKDMCGITETDLPLFIVEDPVSAMRLADTGKVNAAALMGTYLTNDGSLELFDTYKPYKSGSIVICLDNDVPIIATKLRRQLISVYPADSVFLVVPPDDPKDLNDEELDKLIRVAYG